MSKYEYSEGESYLSEDSAITIRRIPDGVYNVIANKGSMSGKSVFISKIGTQKVVIVME